MSYKIEEIEGIGPSYAAKLQDVGITTSEIYLGKAGSKAGRKALASDTGISEKLLLEWANMADLMRISGVGKQYAELLEDAGVDTVKELRTRNAANLAEKMKTTNDTKKVTNAIISESLVQKWIDQAKELDPAVSH